MSSEQICHFLRGAAAKLKGLADLQCLHAAAAIFRNIAETFWGQLTQSARKLEKCSRLPGARPPLCARKSRRPATSDKMPERHLLPLSRLSATVVAARDHSCPNKNLQCRDRGLFAGGEEYEARAISRTSKATCAKRSTAQLRNSRADPGGRPCARRSPCLKKRPPRAAGVRNRETQRCQVSAMRVGPTLCDVAQDARAAAWFQRERPLPCGRAPTRLQRTPRGRSIRSQA